VAQAPASLQSNRSGITNHAGHGSDTVLATVEGRTLTYGNWKNTPRASPAMQQNAMRNRRQFVEQFFLMHRLSAWLRTKNLIKGVPTRSPSHSTG